MSKEQLLQALSKLTTEQLLIIENMIKKLNAHSRRQNSIRLSPV